MKYKTEAEILEMITMFESGTIAENNWRHAEHLIVACYYLSENDFETALEKMRGGILNLLRAFKIDLTEMMPYHETLTVFWMRTVDKFRKGQTEQSLHDICSELIQLFDKDYPLKFYSRELLFSDKARTEYVEPDLP